MEEFLSNDRLISHHRTRQDYIPPPENTLMFAYGDRRYEKLAYELTLVSDILKLKILKEITEDFHRADFVTLALLSSQLLSILIDHFQETKNVEIRELASRTVRQISAVKLGKEHLMKSNALEQISSLMDDPIAQIRMNSYETMLNISEFQEGIDYILQSDILFLLVDKLIEEKDLEILKKVLLLIKNLLYGENGTYKTLMTAIISRLHGLLENKDREIRELSVLCLSCLSFLEAGKLKILAEPDCLKSLCELLRDPITEVREAASLALASLAQMNQGKAEILPYFEIVAGLLKDASEKVQLNIIELIGSLAEHPEGRSKSMKCLGVLEALKEKSEFLKEYVIDTMNVITWKP